MMDAGLLKGSFRFIFTTSLLAYLPAGKPRRVSCVAKTRRCTEALLFSLITPASHCTSSDNGDTCQIMLCCLSEESSQMGAVSHVVPGRSDRSTVFTQNNKAQCCLCTEFKPAPGLSLGSIHSVLPSAEKLTHTKRCIVYSRTNGWICTPCLKSQRDISIPDCWLRKCSLSHETLLTMNKM